jgi:signal transduction histidine kinase
VFALAVLPVGFVAVVSLAVAGATSAVDIAIPVSQTVLLVAVAAAIGVGVLRYRLYDLDIVVRRSLVVAGLSVAVAAVYGATLVGFGLLVSDRGPVVSAAAVGAAALAALPLRDRVRQAVDRLVYGHLAEPLAVLGALGDRLEGTIAGDVPGAVTEAIRAELRVPFVSVELDGGRAVLSGRRPASPVERFPITHLGTPIGELVVAPRSPAEPLRRAERRLLSELARQAAGVFEAARLAGELRRSREQLVHSREEERRRLRRDLHDGLGPTLAGLTLRADVAAGAVDRDSAFAKTQLAELKEQLQDAVAEVRRVVSDLRPPALDEIGLAEALRQHAARIVGRDQIEMTVAVPVTLGPLPAAIEVAAYRIVGEALTNVVRHSHATRCTVTVSATEDLEVQVRDNGSGLSTHDGTGLGLESMRARATEVGGSLDVSTAPGDGTTVTAHLPVPA